MTPCEERGWKVGDRFILSNGEGRHFSGGSIVELYRDDGSARPLFQLIKGDCSFNLAEGTPGAYIGLEAIQPLEGETNSREELKRQLAETRAQMERLETELGWTEEWEPEGGKYWVSGHGHICHPTTSHESSRDFGTERLTRKQAERARDLMRIHNRALAYVQEHAPDWDGSDAYSVFNKSDGEWTISREGDLASIGAIIGPRYIMRQLADDLNSGRVKL